MLGHIITFVAVIFSATLVVDANKVKPPCKSNAHVCTSIMKYPDGTEFDEGPYCQCPGCSSTWRTDDQQSLSWPHYQRADKTVQYKFCVPIIPERECEPGALAVTLGTSMGDWSPHIREARCACPDNLYQLLGWWRHPTYKHDNKTGQWIYEYFCEKPECTLEKSPCAKIYISHAHEEEVVAGYNFLCSCPSGYKCPDKDDDDKHELETDFRGTYLPRFCKPTSRGRS
ncbi:hypothetical protein ACF0H5_022387 [Mactra antiquata]